MRLFSARHRPVHLGPFALERLPHEPLPRGLDALPPWPPLELPRADREVSLGAVIGEYLDLLDRMRVGPVAPQPAPVPDDPDERARHLKAACHFLDASMVGVARIGAGDWLTRPIVNDAAASAEERAYAAGAAANPVAETSVREGQEAWRRAAQAGTPTGHRQALLIVVEYPRDPWPGEPGTDWIHGAQALRAALRAAEVGAVMANYLRLLGFDARLHTATAAELDVGRALVAGGLGVVVSDHGEARVELPFIGARYGAVAVSTTMTLAPDQPLAPEALGAARRSAAWWLGVGGTRSRLDTPAFRRRAFRMGRHPMERLRRRDRPTTTIDAAAVPRVPKRHDMFIRAAMGELGPKAKREIDGFRMITKSPFGHAMIPVLGAMVPLQYGAAADEPAPGTGDPERNADLVKAALYFLGADMVGISRVPDYAWYSHDVDGMPIEPYHRYAVSILIDQGYDTMEGASGDDWISGAQSMRAYLRAQLVGGVVGSLIRRLGWSARGHSVMDQDVLHIPLLLESGLGELSRIGELVLNPYVGPRFKSGILTTDLPLAVDRPIDFGLQDFCERCNKCARECPCAAIPFGDKVLFNGYEMWKPDVEKCARYRITNAAGSMCGRCMKTCPWNVEGVAAEWPFLELAMHVPAARGLIARLDDRLGRGRINPVKRWWWDLDTDAGGRVVRAARSNRRELTFRAPLAADEQKLACYPVAIAPAPDAPPTPPDRKAGARAYQALREAWARRRA